jgi:hypothetical protein
MSYVMRRYLAQKTPLNKFLHLVSMMRGVAQERKIMVSVHSVSLLFYFVLGSGIKLIWSLCNLENIPYYTYHISIQLFMEYVLIFFLDKEADAQPHFD